MSSQAPACWQLKIFVEAEALEAFSDLLDDYSEATLFREIEEGENKGKWELEIISREMPDMAKLTASFAVLSQAMGAEEPKPELTRVENKNWLKESLISFPPVELGNFYIYGSHIKDPEHGNKIPIRIDAATAFGSGEHQTTKGCLLAMQDISKRKNVKNALDMGCGSGILSVAAAKLWPVDVFGVDIDEESVRVSNENAKINGVAKRVKAEAGNGYNNGHVAQKGPYDLILANILARPLVKMARDLEKNLAQDGVAVLSGLLNRQEQWVINAHRTVGLKLVKVYRINGWSALVMSR